MSREGLMDDSGYNFEPSEAEQQAWNEGYLQGKAEAQEECERCVYSGWKEQMKKHDAKVRADTIKELRIVKQGRTITSTLRTLQLNEQKECSTCENLMFSDCYGECVFGGIVNAHDTCNKWRKKE